MPVLCFKPNFYPFPVNNVSSTTRCKNKVKYTKEMRRLRIYNCSTEFLFIIKIVQRKLIAAHPLKINDISRFSNTTVSQAPFRRLKIQRYFGLSNFTRAWLIKRRKKSRRIQSLAMAR